MGDRVSIEIADGIADVRMARPDKMNALDPAMVDGLANAIARLQVAPGVRAVVLSGEGRAFCAGLDMATMASGAMGNELLARTHGDANLMQHLAWGWRTLPMPVIAAAHGIAFGGGFQILSGADIRVAHPQTRCAIMEAKWGLVPDMAGYALWRTSVRDDVLRELIYTAREFSGVEAHAMGFVTHLSADPRMRAFELARAIAARSPDAVRAMKRLSNLAAHASDAAILQAESDAQAAIMRTPNQIESVRAGMEKRAPVFVK